MEFFDEFWYKWAMKESKHTLPEFVVCINNAGYPASLELHKIYLVLIDEEAIS